MQKQMVLPLGDKTHEQQRQLWKQIPKKSREELLALQAKLIAQAVRAPKRSHQEESDHEANDR